MLNPSVANLGRILRCGACSSVLLGTGASSSVLGRRFLMGASARMDADASADLQPVTILNYVHGAFVEPRSATYIDSPNPATGKLLCRVPDSGREDIDAAVKAGTAAFREWSQTTRAARARLMHRLADLIHANATQLAREESRDQGKTLKQAAGMEIPRCVTNLRFYADLLLNFHDTTTTTEEPLRAQSTTRHEPIGVVGVISPWNLPLYLLTWKIAPALAMGNCVVAKPSELTSLTAFRLAQLATEAGFPPGVLNIVFGCGQTAGQALVEHPAVSAISFTGGTVTGRRIAAAVAPLGKKVSLELGGKNPAIVFADCDLDAAVSTSVRAAFANQGEICLCCSRVFVQRPIYEQFLTRLAHQASSLLLGDPLDENTQMGALVSSAHREKVLSYLHIAKQEGARIVCGGDTDFRLAGFEQGFFLPPTIITDVHPKSRLMQEEIFGPIVCVSPFDTEEEAVLLANDVEYGLAASVWTRDGARAQRVAQQIKSGVVWINCWMVRDLASPFGGVKASGYGREGGRYSLEFFSDIKTITTSQQ